MITPVEDFQEAIENLKESSPAIILAKAKEAYNHCAYNKNVPAHRQSKSTPSEMIKSLKNKNSKFTDKIFHRDGSTTLITSDNYYLRFYNL